VKPRLNEFSGVQIARQIAAREITAEAVVRDCLARIDAREPTVHAWASLDREHALAQARELDRGPIRGPLHGVPIGVKDVIDTADLPTEMGSPIFAGNRPRADAACVAIVRAAGAVILGKTVTAELAGVGPGATTNPHNPLHTPGGSSSGSGAAVADHMVPVAFGTQTGGSVLRPASFCGVIGFKPTFGRYNRRGLLPAAESLDTIGTLARSLEDVALLDDVLVGRPASERKFDGAPSIGVARTHLWETAQPAGQQAIEDAARRLAAAGARVREVVLPKEFEGLNRARARISYYERARAIGWEWTHHRDRISSQLRPQIEAGLALPYAEYAEAMRLAGACRERAAELFEAVDVVLTPCVTGEAPVTLISTGDVRFQENWTLLHMPALCLPTYRGSTGLPIGIQLVAAREADDRLLAIGAWAAHALRV
jgi:Asp-tRNA(Asn)/Glu-tRNA(Gln) amidotransferase A subunit family amidase